MKVIGKNRQSVANAENNPPAGLRQRQKLARTERILSSAATLFNAHGFEDTTMAAIADNAEVSTPTVFNYFKTKEELLLALVLQVHHETREKVEDFRPKASAGRVDTISEFLQMYTRKSLESISRKTWRHVESTRIRMPGSDFVKNYDALATEMLSDFQQFLVLTLASERIGMTSNLPVVAKFIFNHWSALFVELVRDESLTIENHVKQLKDDLTALIETIKIDD